MIVAFLRDNLRWLAAGALLTLASSFGQTFFISIFAGEIRAAFDLSHGEWGGIYTLGTLASAAAMLFAGGLTDRFRVRHLSSIILVLFAVTCVAMAMVPTAWALIIVIFGLRFCGQGMLSHTSAVGLGRWFSRNRGRANAFISMGFLVGESLLPFSFVLLMSFIGWRMSWGVAAVLVLLFLPALQLLLRKERRPSDVVDQTPQVGMDNRHWNRRDALSHWLFWIAALAVTSPSVLNTALFFNQVHLTEIKGWSLASFVALFPIYSATSLASTFALGAIADRFGTARLFQICFLPGAATFLLMGLGDSLWHAALGFLLLGLMHGALSTIGGAFWPEYYGTRSLGAIRTIATSMMVFGSAIGPGITGYLIDWGIDYEDQLTFMGVYYLALAGLLLICFERARRYLPSQQTPPG